MKRLITYKRKKINDFLYEDPNTNHRVTMETSWQTIFTETPYNLADWRFICIVEYWDDETEENINYFMNLDTAFEFTFIEEDEANVLLSELWDIVVNDFVFTDNRPIDDWII